MKQHADDLVWGVIPLARVCVLTGEADPDGKAKRHALALLSGREWQAVLTFQERQVSLAEAEFLRLVDAPKPIGRSARDESAYVSARTNARAMADNEHYVLAYLYKARNGEYDRT